MYEDKKIESNAGTCCDYDEEIQEDDCGCQKRHRGTHVKCDWILKGHYIENHHLCLNLAGLTDNLNYKLLSKRHNKIQIGTIGGKRFNGKIKQVGIDYLDLNVDCDLIATILKDKIKHIKIK
ncbi:MAG TPA: hypothetical protein VNQ57_02750 [Ureibacillus sp.]|nr:hypothetical protein [Ureibacillus sp.]